MRTDIIKNVKNSRIAVLGAGKSGQSIASLLAGHGAHVLLSESRCSREYNEIAASLRGQSIEIETGGHSKKVYECDWLVLSPGIALTHPVADAFIKNGKPVYGELEAAFWFCRVPVIAVTGSNGKTTTTALIGQMLRDYGIHTAVCGNIGIPFSACVQNMDEGWIVLEVSSFQLETIKTFHSNISVFLNLTPDHLDRHGNMEEYGRLKSRIFENHTESDHLIYWSEDSAVHDLISRAKSKTSGYGSKKSVENDAWVENGKIVIKADSCVKTLAALKDLTLKGEHNALNAMAAALAAFKCGVSAESVSKTLKSFKGLPHRMEIVCERRGILWVNDSKATNVDSVWYALGGYERPVLLIMGGRDKDSDFSRLIPRIEGKVKTLILLGEAAGKILNQLTGYVPVHVVASMFDAVQLADELSEPEDVVLLSPACASFDMFKNYEDRGDQFKKHVKALI